MNKLLITQEEFDEIQDLLMEYSLGNYDVQADISASKNERDTILTGINMLGEELKDTTVSRDYFSSIFNAVTDPVFILDIDGAIKNINQAAHDIAGYSRQDAMNAPVDQIIALHEGGKFFATVKNQLETQSSAVFEGRLIHSDKQVTPVENSCSIIHDRDEKFTGYMIISRDITERLEAEKRIVQAIVSTQSKEQKRMAADLHDSLGQEMAGVSLFLNTILERVKEDEESKQLVDSARNIIQHSIQTLREICFDLMPKTLELEGYGAAAIQLAARLNQQNEINFVVHSNQPVPRLDTGVELLLFRITQEFINNTIKHAEASQVDISIEVNDSIIFVGIKDNGKGFEIDQLDNNSIGRGLKTMETRAKAFDGSFQLISKPGKGTAINISFPC